MSKEIFSPATLPPPVGYSHVAKVNKGTLIYLAGQVSSDASGKLVGEGNFEAQAEQVFTQRQDRGRGRRRHHGRYRQAEHLPRRRSQLRPTCRRCGRSATAIVNTEKPPASTLVVVSRLARPGWLIEIEAVAAIDDVKRKRRPRRAPFCYVSERRTTL